MLNEIYVYFMCLLKNALLVHLTVLYQTIQISPAVSFFFSVCSCHLFFCSPFLFAFFVLSSTNLLSASPSYLYASLSLSSVFPLSLTGRARYLLPAETTAQNLKLVRVYIFCVRLFIPYITMHAHASIILSV